MTADFADGQLPEGWIRVTGQHILCVDTDLSVIADGDDPNLFTIGFDLVDGKPGPLASITLHDNQKVDLLCAAARMLAAPDY